MRSALTGFMLLLALQGAWGKEAARQRKIPQLEQRVMALAEELRCLVCQNQSLADSHADLAVDLKNQIRDKLKQGMTNQEILDYMVERYGDFVLYRPPLKATTLMLWFGPFLLLGAGLASSFSAWAGAGGGGGGGAERARAQRHCAGREEAERR